MNSSDAHLATNDDGMAPAKAATVDPSALDLLGLARIVRMRWKVIVGTMIVFLLLSLVVLLQITPLYSSSALVVLDSRKNSVQDLSNVLAGLSDNETTVRNQVAILTSRSLAERVIAQLGLASDPEFNKAEHSGFLSHMPLIGDLFDSDDDSSALAEAERTELSRVAVVDKFLDRISATPIPSSSAIKVTCLSASPTKAAKICNAVTKAYVDDQISAKLDASQKATQWLTDRINELATQLQSSDASVQQYKADNNITETNDGNSVIEQQVTSINSQLVEARADLAEKQATFNRVSDLVKSGRATDVSQVVASPLISQLRNQETEILKQQAEFSSRYGPNHPKIKDLESERQDLQTKINQEVQRVVETVGNDLSIAQAKVNSLTGSLRQVEGRSTDERKAEVKLKSLESSTDSLRALHSTLLARLKETQNQQDIETPDARTISDATTSKYPSFPKKNLVLIAMGLAGLAFGLLFAVLMDRSGRGFRTGAEVESISGLPLLATIPEMARRGRKSKGVSAQVVNEPLSAYSEAIRGLLQTLYHPNAEAATVLVITSTVPAEGKTLTAVSLARLAAQTGKRVALLDGDLRNPTVADAIEITATAAGMVAALQGKTPVQECFVADPISGVQVLAGTKSKFKPDELLSAEKIERVLAEIRGSFDLIVIDTAPLLPVNDAKLFSRFADSVLLVVRWERTPREAVLRVIDGLGKVGRNTAGIALSRADMARFHGYSYGYGDLNYAYRKYYNEH